MKDLASCRSAAVLLCVVALLPAAKAERRMPDLDGVVAWHNSKRLTKSSLRGRVVLVNFWTYSCINSLRELPYMKAWAAKYEAAGLVVIGVHTPEFSFEKDDTNVKQAIQDYAIRYPIAVDNNYAVWRAFDNNYWPANYIIDGKGRIRVHYFGEGAYEQMERIIRDLLRENGATSLDGTPVTAPISDVEAPPSENVQSPETYVGYSRSERFASSGPIARDRPRTYTMTMEPWLNRWGLHGLWEIGAERGVLRAGGGKIVFRFHTRDVHMVLAPSADGKPVRFRVTLDGAEPGLDHGSDTSSDGAGTVQKPRLYQLIRQKGSITNRTITIAFLDPAVQAFTFTFG